jgi:two-component system capsular synthesis response regulator RcsB
VKEFSMRLVIADDHPAVLIGIGHVLESVTSMELVGLVKNSTELIHLLDRQQCDVLVTDYAMPGGEYGDGITLFEFLRRRYPQLKMVVMTMMDNPGVLRTLVNRGLTCILCKSDDSSHLIPAVHAAHSGGQYFSPAIIGYVQSLNMSEHGEVRKKELTKREFEIVRLYVSGLTVNEIAGRLHRSKQTISSQKTSAMKKLGIVREADLFKYAMETGLLSSSSAATAA